MSYGSTYPIIPYPEQAVGFSDHQQSYYSKFDSDSYYDRPAADFSLSLPSSQRRLTDERLTCDRNLGWSIDWATAFLVDHLDPANSPDTAETLRNISQRASQLAQEGQCKQLVYSAFNKLNQTLFAGHLKDAVYIGFSRLGPEVSGATHTHGQGPNRRVQRISIVLNIHVLQNSSGPHIICYLIHQMLHAYFLVACGPEDEKQTGYGRLEHGEPFLKVMHTIKELARSRGTVWIPGLLGRRPPLRHPYDDYYPRNNPKSQRKQWYCSHCIPPKSATPVCDIDAWYLNVCKPLLDLPDVNRKASVHIYNNRNQLEETARANLDPSKSSVEFFFKNDKPVLVPSEKLGPFLSIRRAFDTLGCRYMELPPEVSREGFMLLLELLHTGTYSPDVTHAVSGAVALGASAKGPPIIKPVRPNSPQYLLASITVFKTGIELGFEDLLGLALGRMRAQPVTHEDPVDVISAIYSGGGKDPHPDMRTWVRDFLQAAPVLQGDTHQWGVGRAGGLNEGLVVENCNLVKLRGEMCFKERFAALLEGCAALHIDVLKVEECLLAQGGGRVAGVPVGVGVGERRLLGAPSVNVNMGVFGHGGVGVGVGGVGLGVGGPLGLAAREQMAREQLALGLRGPMGGAPGVGLGWGEMDEWARYREEVEGARLGWSAGLGERFEERWGF